VRASATTAHRRTFDGAAFPQIFRVRASATTAHRRTFDGAAHSLTTSGNASTAPGSYTNRRTGAACVLPH